MPHWIHSYRVEVGRLPKVSITDLRKNDLLNGFNATEINRVDVTSFSPDLVGRVPVTEQVRLKIKLYDSQGNEQIAESYIKLTKTPCEFGGSRYWFVCPQSSCKKRVGVMYCKNEVWACRTCHYLCYASQNETKSMARLYVLDKLDMDIDTLYSKIKRHYYKGKPTRLKRKLINLERIADVYLDKFYSSKSA